MPKISSELAVQAVGCRYDLVLIASRRTRELMRGDAPLVPRHPSQTVTALAEIEAGLIGRDYLNKPQDMRDRPRDRMRPTQY